MTTVLHPHVEKDLHNPLCAHWLRAAAKCTAIFKGALLFSLAQLHIWMIQGSWEDPRRWTSLAASFKTRKGGHYFVATIAHRNLEERFFRSAIFKKTTIIDLKCFAAFGCKVKMQGSRMGQKKNSQISSRKSAPSFPQRLLWHDWNSSVICICWLDFFFSSSLWNAGLWHHIISRQSCAALCCWAVRRGHANRGEAWQRLFQRMPCELAQRVTVTSGSEAAWLKMHSIPV